MRELLFSVIIPVYNVEAYLLQCVESVEKQRFDSCELILVDDGSTDSSGSMCDRLAEKYENTRVVHQKNAGLSAARNTGVRNSHGQYLVFLDSDDMLYADSLKNLAVAIEEQPDSDFIISRRCTVKDNEITPCDYHFGPKMMSETNPVHVYQNLQKLPDCWLGVWIFSVKRSYCLEKNLYFYEGILHEDEEWVPRLFFNTKHIGFNNEILYCNRVDREGSITATPNIKREFDKLKILDLLSAEFDQPQYSDAIRELVMYREQQILFGICCEAALYRSNSRYDELLQRVASQKKYIQDASRTIYRITYWGLQILGPKITCTFLRKIDSWKRNR